MQDSLRRNITCYRFRSSLPGSVWSRSGDQAPMVTSGRFAQALPSALSEGKRHRYRTPGWGCASLVGLRIAEFRRQPRSERVAYLCPTRQLARQVHAQALKYGIKTHVSVGKQRDYPPLLYNEGQQTVKGIRWRELMLVGVCIASGGAAWRISG
jgi:hypothetical protein